jgi:hypothetical protein
MTSKFLKQKRPFRTRLKQLSCNEPENGASHFSPSFNIAATASSAE